MEALEKTIRNGLKILGESHSAFVNARDRTIKASDPSGRITVPSILTTVVWERGTKAAEESLNEAITELTENTELALRMISTRNCESSSNEQNKEEAINEIQTARREWKAEEQVTATNALQARTMLLRQYAESVCAGLHQLQTLAK
jgi:hypothetical protein